MKRFLLAYVAPTYLLLAAVVLPLASGSRTLFLRDAFTVHLPMKAEQAQAMEEGELPLILSRNSGGQPLMGNPNSVPLYPDNLLFLVSPLLWAFNAHFWLHLLLAPWAMYALARAWGLGRPGAWAAGVCYAFSGFFLSHMSFYNLVAGAALAPALAAAMLGLVEHRRGRDLVAVGVVWALLLLAGEPLLAGLALLLSLTAAVAKVGRRALIPRTLAAGAGSLLCGTLLAAPQLLELLRVLPLSARGHRGYSLEARLVSSFHPAQVLEWFLPTGFGRPDQLLGGAFWGYPFYGGEPAFFFSLAPGALALVLVGFAGWRRSKASLWAWSAVAVALFFALGKYNPAARVLLSLPGAEMLRYPIKLWLAVALPASLLAGIGFERALDLWEEGHRPWRGWLLALALAYGSLAVGFWFFPEAAWSLLRALIPERLGGRFVTFEVGRWLGIAAGCALVTGVLGALAFFRRRSWAAPALLALHGASQLFFLAPLLATDEAAVYLSKPPLLEQMPADAEMVHGSAQDLFGHNRIETGSYPEPSVQWLMRRTAFELDPPYGILAGRSYELNISPEGLSSFLTRAARDAVKQLDDPRRLRLLEAWGVDRLLLHRPLTDGAEASAELLARYPSFGGEIRAYALPGASPDVFFARRLVLAPHLNAALEALLLPDFDPSTATVLPGAGPVQEGPGGTVEVLSVGSDGLEVEVRAEGPGAVVWQRSHLPLYRAHLDGEEAAVEVANLHRIAVRVPAGTHRLRIWIDRRPFLQAWALSLVGLLGLVLLVRRNTANIDRS
ncbi:MAG: hypothetical protein KDD47_10410 [Acidobacteria bacterium]|nr:hypothetical protein [Acidobacteriota bacterium]